MSAKCQTKVSLSRDSRKVGLETAILQRVRNRLTCRAPGAPKMDGAKADYRYFRPPAMLVCVGGRSDWVEVGL